MSIEHTIRERRSIRTFTNESVPQSLVLELLNTAVWAPNHRLREPWRFIYADGEGKENLVNGLYNIYEKYGEFKGLTKHQKQAFIKKTLDVPAFIIVVMHVDSNALIRDEDYAAVSCMIQNFQLIGWENKLGMVWNTGEVFHSSDFCDLVGVKENEMIVGILSLGFFNKTPKPHPRTAVEKKIVYL